ncbi:MAG: prepilin peptidase [Thermomicrobiales bacterium]|nr:prepilin peptidase [Thermomicrobiales bacterium]
MSGAIIVVSAFIGLFAGAALWNVSRNQATRRPLFGSPSCGAEGVLPAMSWLPLFGFGMARSCSDGSPQSSKRALFELAVAGYFGVAAWRIDDGTWLVSVLLFTIPLLVIFLVDSWTRLIFTNVILLGLAFGLASAAVDGPGELGSSALAMVIAAAVFAGLFFLAIVIYRNPKVVPFGLGDVYLAAMIGAMVRLDDVAAALFYGVFLAGGSVALLLVLKRVSRKQAVPYGPYLVLGALIALVL